MSNWISKAANVFKRDAPETAQPFEVLCECRQSHAGIRRGRHQHLVCKACGASLFVLPRNVYPIPVVPKSRPKPTRDRVQPEESHPQRNAPPSRPTVDREVSTPTEDEPAVAAAAEVPRRPSPVPERRRSRKGKPAAARPAKPQKRPPAELPRRPFWTPLRGISLAVLLVVVITGWWMVRQASLARAAETVQRLAEPAVAQVQQGEWLEARPDLVQVAAALDRLGRRDPEAETLRQYHREVEALFHLSSVSLEGLLSAARQEYEERDEEDSHRGEELAERFAGEWLILEGPLEFFSVPVKRGKEERVGLQLPWSLDPRASRVVVEAEFPIFEELDRKQVEGKTFVFAGAIEHCAWRGKDRTWIVRLRPESGFLWVHPVTYEALGFGVSPLRNREELQALLARQAEQMGVQP